MILFICCSQNVWLILIILNFIIAGYTLILHNIFSTFLKNIFSILYFLNNSKLRLTLHAHRLVRNHNVIVKTTIQIYKLEHLGISVNHNKYIIYTNIYRIIPN